MAPWFDALAPLSRAHRPDTAVAAALAALWPVEPSRQPRSANGCTVRPVPAGEPLGALAYEQTIAVSGELPTRDNAHDWYNGLTWLSYPQTKQALNRLQVATPQSPVGANGRTRRRDALTLFDENGALLLTCRPGLATALALHDWHTLFVANRQAWSTDISVWVVGHALFEKLETPRLDLCAHARVCVLTVEAWQHHCRLPLAEQRNALDAWLAADLERSLHEPADLRPLPLMGVPGWHAGNSVSDFYNNRQVFRPAKVRQTSSASG